MKKVSLAYYLCETVGKITNENEANIEIYNLLSKNIHDLQRATELKKLRLNFVQNLLEITGFWPKGKKMDNPDQILAEVLEREIYSERVGRKIST